MRTKGLAELSILHWTWSARLIGVLEIEGMRSATERIEAKEENIVTDV